VADALLTRLQSVYTDEPWRMYVKPQKLSWPAAPFGTRIDDVRTVVVHETSGWPSRVNGLNDFYAKFFGGAAHKPHMGDMTQLYLAGGGSVYLGMDLPLRTSHARPLNGSSLGCEAGHGWGSSAYSDNIGPYTSRDASRQLIPLTPKPLNLWIPLSGNQQIASPTDDDVPGIKFWFRYQSFDEVVVTLWTTPRYAGPWRQEQPVPEMLFTEWQYRSWALLARYLAEQFLIPRNFPLLPHKLRSPGEGTKGGQHGMISDTASFQAIVRSDEVLSRSLATLGLTAAQLADVTQLQPVYANTVANGGNVETVPAGVTPGGEHYKQFERNNLWNSAVALYRGFLGHGFSGDFYGKDHDCPGPMFDWHRFAREVWDWWWHPFDFDTARATTNVLAREYSSYGQDGHTQLRDGDTQLKEYWNSTPSAPYLARAVPGIHGASGSPMTFQLEQGSRVYALANGELVAARFPSETGDVSLAFVLVRHEVFHLQDPLAGATWFAFNRSGAGRLDYDRQPSAVYSLYIHLGRPTGMSFDEVNSANPDWLNRLLIREKEAHLGVKFQSTPQTQPGWTVPQSAWDSSPPGTPMRPTVFEAWRSDDNNLTPTLKSLSNGDLTIMAGSAFWTRTQVLLGDFLGQAGVIRHDAGGTQYGLRVEVFSRGLVSSDFVLTESDAEHGWNPPAAVQRPAVRYPTEWSRLQTDMSDSEKQGLQASGVVLDLLPQWETVQLATQLIERYPDDARLPGQGWLVHYDPYTFMAWLNDLTWKSEWPKYQITDPAGVPQAPVQRS